MTRQLIKGTNYSTVTGPSNINSSSPTKSLPSFMRSSSSHPGSAHKSALGREGVVLFLLSTMGFGLVFSRGYKDKEWGWVFTYVPVWHLHFAARKHSCCWAQTAEWKGWILTAGHESKPLFSAYQNIQPSRFHGNRERGGKEQAPPWVPFWLAYEFRKYFCHRLWLNSSMIWWVAVRTCADIYAWLNFVYTWLCQVLKGWL